MKTLQRNQVFTHRGLEPSHPNYYPESSYEAFADQLSRGFGIEFDPNFVKDGIVVSHDNNLKRITEGKDTRDFHNVTVTEIIKTFYGNPKKGRIPTLDEVFSLIRSLSSTMNALHLKGKFQEKKYLDQLITKLNEYSDIFDRLLIFDAKPETARYLKQVLSQLHIAPSVAHLYDIQRFNTAVLGTLISVDDALLYKKEALYDWVWLDEWDRTDENGNDKTLYNENTFKKLKDVGYKISLVTPELHGTSPGLLGGEAHPDAKDKEILFKRIEIIISLKPDAICTDYPEEFVKE